MVFKATVLYTEIDPDYPLRLGAGCLVGKTHPTYTHWLYTKKVLSIDEETGIFETDNFIYMPENVIDDEGEE